VWWGKNYRNLLRKSKENIKTGIGETENFPTAKKFFWLNLEKLTTP
jgi:hypothetical protein